WPWLGIGKVMDLVPLSGPNVGCVLPGRTKSIAHVKREAGSVPSSASVALAVNVIVSPKRNIVSDAPERGLSDVSSVITGGVPTGTGSGWLVVRTPSDTSTLAV